jgi:hypothetical protein
MDERRDSERTRAGFQAEIRRADTGDVVGHLADISEGGLMLVGDRSLKVDEIVGLAIELPRDAGKASSVEIEARVCWIQPEVEPGMLAVGLEWTDPAAAASETVKRMRRLLG